MKTMLDVRSPGYFSKGDTFYGRALSSFTVSIFLVFYFQGYLPQMVMALIPALTAIGLTFWAFRTVHPVAQVLIASFVALDVFGNTLLKTAVLRGVHPPMVYSVLLIVFAVVGIMLLFLDYNAFRSNDPLPFRAYFIKTDNIFDLCIVLTSSSWMLFSAYVTPLAIRGIPMMNTTGLAAFDVLLAVLYCRVLIDSKAIRGNLVFGAVGVLAFVILDVMMPYLDGFSDPHLTVIGMLVTTYSLMVCFIMSNDPVTSFYANQGDVSPHMRMIILACCAFGPAITTFGVYYVFRPWVTVTISSFMLIALSARTLLLVRNRTSAIERINAINTQLKKETTHDRLTGIANQMFMDESLRESIDQREALIYAIIDIDGFKHINNTYGFSAGDEIIVAIAKELEIHMANRGLVSRMSADKFSLLLTESDHRQSARDLIESIVNRLPSYIIISSGHRVGLSYSAGVYRAVRNEDVIAVQAHAQTAAAQAKLNVGSSVIEANRDSNKSSPYRINLLGFKNALSQSEVELGFSPIYTATHDLVAFHAFPVWVPVSGWQVEDLFVGMEQVDSTEVIQEWLAHVADNWSLTYEVPLQITFPRFSYNTNEKLDRVTRLITEISEHNRNIHIDISSKYLVIPREESYQLIEHAHQVGLTTCLTNFGEGPHTSAYEAANVANLFAIDVDNFTSFSTGEGVVTSLINFASLANVKVKVVGSNIRERFPELVSRADYYQEKSSALRMTSLQARFAWEQYGKPGFIQAIGGQRERATRFELS